MVDSILVPTDGSDHAERAADHAFALADRFDATVHVLGVADVDAAAGPFDVGGVSEEFVERVEAESESAVEDALARADDDLTVESAVERGDPPETVLDCADERDVDLIAMGTRGRSGLAQAVAGSVAEHVVRHAGRPVLTARATDADPVTEYERVMVPTDGSDAAAAAVDHAVAVADAFDATVHAVHVVDLGVLATDAVPTADVIDSLEDAGQEAVDDVADAAREAGLDVVTEVREGFPGPGLLEYADEEEIDLIAMGTHGRTGIGRLLLGSTTEKAIRNAEAPVISVSTGESGDGSD